MFYQVLLHILCFFNPLMISSHCLLRGPTHVGLRLGWALAGLWENEAVSWCATSLPVCQGYLHRSALGLHALHSPCSSLGQKGWAGLELGSIPKSGRYRDHEVNSVDSPSVKGQPSLLLRC